MSSINLYLGINNNNNNNHAVPESSICSNDFIQLRKIYKACLQSDLQTAQDRMDKLSMECRNQINERMPNIISNEIQDLQKAIINFAWQYFSMKNSNASAATDDTLELLKIDEILYAKAFYIEDLEGTQRKIIKLQEIINNRRDQVTEVLNNIRERHHIINLYHVKLENLRKHERETVKVLKKFKTKELLTSAVYETEKNEILAKKKEIKELNNIVNNLEAREEDNCSDKKAVIKDKDRAKLELSRLKELLLAKDGRFEIEMKHIHECRDRLDVLRKKKSKDKKALQKAEKKGKKHTIIAKETLKSTEAKIKKLDKRIDRANKKIVAIKSGCYIKPAVKSGNNNNNQ